jgi:HPt (histidine-containing phosphotransfer) domain-containing protein
MSAVFDPQCLSRQAMGDRDLMREVLIMFREQTRELVGGLNRERDLAGWCLPAHTLKGTARTVGASALADVAAEAEELARHRLPVLPDRVTAEQERLVQALSRTAEATDRAIADYLPTL